MTHSCTCASAPNTEPYRQEKYIRDFLLERVADTLKMYGILNIKRVADMNCGDGSWLYPMVKNPFLNIKSYVAFAPNHTSSASINKVIFDNDLLEEARNRLGIYGNIEFEEGSIFNHCIYTDILLIPELIQNISDNDIEEFEENVFFRMEPKVVIITTPNADYHDKSSDYYDKSGNVKYTRDKFVEWLNNMTNKYKYNFYLDNVTGIARIFWQIGSDTAELQGCKPTLGAVLYHRDLHVINPVA